MVFVSEERTWKHLQMIFICQALYLGEFSPIQPLHFTFQLFFLLLFLLLWGLNLPVLWHDELGRPCLSLWQENLWHKILQNIENLKFDDFLHDSNQGCQWWSFLWPCNQSLSINFDWFLSVFQYLSYLETPLSLTCRVYIYIDMT